jgi:hypothetical protein
MDVVDDAAMLWSSIVKIFVNFFFTLTPLYPVLIVAVCFVCQQTHPSKSGSFGHLLRSDPIYQKFGDCVVKNQITDLEQRESDSAAKKLLQTMMDKDCDKH